MGTTVSSPAPLASPFQRLSAWDMKAAKRLLADYKEKDLDFGLDAQGLAEIVHGDKEWAEAIIDAFGGTNGIVNALAFICGACLVSTGPALEKANLVFDTLDFDATEQISMDEMTIVFLCCARGFCVMSGVGTVPSDEELENVTLQAYRELSKNTGQGVSKAEFTKWTLRFLHGAPTASSHADASLEDMMLQFGIVPPPPAKSLADQVLSEMATEATENNEEIANVEAEAMENDVEAPLAHDAEQVVASDENPVVETTEQEEHNQEASVQSPGPDLQREASGTNEPEESGGEYAVEFDTETPRFDAVEANDEEFIEAEGDASAPYDLEAEASDEVAHEANDVAPEDFPHDGSLQQSPEPAPLEMSDENPFDLNAFDTYDYTGDQYDSSSGLPPPELDQEEVVEPSDINDEQPPLDEGLQPTDGSSPAEEEASTVGDDVNHNSNV
ncbi:hypothetical protein Poli38472_005253 [Pythium oligandrum]|uniref:Uncharacterized protein n=1 Tax=Pythium oligandrum TaxID=41045 RepID=A0A8K1CG79_PYTOL|nr:hypothetical protein Poli38472_005253 [Pythium oligandrum]|eukprot:TMW62635.1 hypothetical protein Poli38472_005253 [Pythium oligandrum]